jgi:hypothetical protein
MLMQKDIGKKGKFIIYCKNENKAWPREYLSHY